MGLSAVVITFNEESNIERCLASVSFADEIVVLDSNSTDRTVEIARRFTDRIDFREFTGMSEQKAAAVAMASNEWFLMIDADEALTPELGEEIAEVIARPGFDSYRMPRLSYFLGKPIRHSGWYPDYQTRLSRKSGAVFPMRLVHAPMEVAGTCGTLTHDMLHFTYPTLADYMRKVTKYSALAARQAHNEGRRFRPTDLLLRPGFRFLKKYLLQQGFRDGIHGFVLSALTAATTALRYAYLWEMSLQAGCGDEKNYKENAHETDS